MTAHEILQELDLPLFVPRPAEEPAAPASALLVCLSEAQAAFSDAHQTQLQKIMAYLGFAETEYSLCFADTTPAATSKLILAFGPSSLQTTAYIQTHSISNMLANPGIKREVLHAIQPLKRNA